MSELDCKAELNLTVAIPTYNGAKRLPALLDRLRSQTNTDSITWEIIVCDNSSTDNTKGLVDQYQADWPHPYALRYLFAAEQGAAFARQYAVESANGELIAFLDDDNLPEEDWVIQAYQFAHNYPKAGAFGSQIHGKFESQLPAELENIKCFLAIIERGEQPHRYEPSKKILPPAAGLVVRKQVWLDTVPKRLFLNNKGKSAGLASEDLEAILHIQKAGWEVWYNPAMVVHHDIPNGRLRKDYLVTLFRCVGLSRFHIRLLGLPKWRYPIAIPGYIANDIRKLAFHRLRHGTKSQLSTTETCQRELLSSTVASPLFLLKKVAKDGQQAYTDKRHTEYRYWLKHISQAFESGRFELYQQPVVELKDSSRNSQTKLGEAEFPYNQQEILLRLREDDGNHVLPGSFFPTAQRYGLMRNIDRWVIRHLFSWLKKQKEEKSFTLEPVNRFEPAQQALYSVNLSSESVEDSAFTEFIALQLSQSDLSPQLFCFEIPAVTALSSPIKTRRLIDALHHLGCLVTLDDAIPNLQTTEFVDQLPIDHIKLKLTSLQTSEKATESWSALKQLQKRNSVQVIAKGIESPSMLQTISRQGIYYMQGYQVSHPQRLTANWEAPKKDTL